MADYGGGPEDDLDTESRGLHPALAPEPFGLPAASTVLTVMTVGTVLWCTPSPSRRSASGGALQDDPTDQCRVVEHRYVSDIVEHDHVGLGQQ